MPEIVNHASADERYPTGELVRRLLALAWRFREDCLWSLVLSVVLLLLGIVGLKLLGVVIDVIRHALDPSLPPPVYPFGWNRRRAGRRCRLSRRWRWRLWRRRCCARRSPTPTT